MLNRLFITKIKPVMSTHHANSFANRCTQVTADYSTLAIGIHGTGKCANTCNIVPMFQTAKPCFMWNLSIQTNHMFSRRNLQVTAKFPRQNFTVMLLRRNLQVTTKFPHQSLTTTLMLLHRNLQATAKFLHQSFFTVILSHQSLLLLRQSLTTVMLIHKHKFVNMFTGQITHQRTNDHASNIHGFWSITLAPAGFRTLGRFLLSPGISIPLRTVATPLSLRNILASIILT